MSRRDWVLGYYDDDLCISLTCEKLLLGFVPQAPWQMENTNCVFKLMLPLYSWRKG